MDIKRLLVPIDFSRDSLNALQYAGDLAVQFGAEILVVHVVEPTYFADVSDLYLAHPDLAKLMDEQWRMATQELTRAAARLQERALHVQTEMKRGSPAPVIVDTAKRSGADLIVMGTHGRTGLAHMLIGSVAEKVVRTASCPVLTVRGARKPSATKRPARR